MSNIWHHIAWRFVPNSQLHRIKLWSRELGRWKPGILEVRLMYLTNACLSWFPNEVACGPKRFVSTREFFELHYFHEGENGQSRWQFLHSDLIIWSKVQLAVLCIYETVKRTSVLEVQCSRTNQIKYKKKDYIFRYFS